jgi:hypothetical protein
MTNDRKRKSLTLLVLTVIAIVLIAAALPRLEFQPGIPLPGWENRSDALPIESMTLPPITVNTFIRAILGVILLSALAYSGYKVIKGASWKEILSSSRFIAILGLVVLVVIGILFALVNLSITALLSAPEILSPALAIKGPQLARFPQRRPAGRFAFGSIKASCRTWSHSLLIKFNQHKRRGVDFSAPPAFDLLLLIVVRTQ